MPPGLVRNLLFLAAGSAVCWASAAWLSAYFAVPRPLAVAGVVLVLFLALIPGETWLKSRWPAAASRQLPRGRADRYASVSRFAVILYALTILVTQTVSLCDSRAGLDPADVLQLTSMVMMGLCTGHTAPVPSSRLADGSGTVRPGSVRTLSQAFAVVMILSLVALLYDGIRPGTLPNGIGIALAAGILVVQFGFWREDRRERQERS